MRSRLPPPQRGGETVHKVLPKKELLKEFGLMQFDGICTAIRTGNVRLFSHHMMESSADFLKMGTYLLMMKLKFMVYRTLCQGVYGLMQKKLGQGLGGGPHSGCGGTYCLGYFLGSLPPAAFSACDLLC